ncbi:hypothetical protein C7E25_23905, partial [Stenotrophomonas maltophilia]
MQREELVQALGLAFTVSTISLTTGLVLHGAFASSSWAECAVPYLQSLGLQREELVQALGLAFTVSTISLTTGLVLHGAF